MSLISIQFFIKYKHREMESEWMNGGENEKKETECKKGLEHK